MPGAAGVQGTTFKYKVLKNKGKEALNSGAVDRANSEAPNKTCLVGLDIKEVISESQTQELWVVNISVKLRLLLSRVHLQFKSVTILMTHDHPESCSSYDRNFNQVNWQSNNLKEQLLIFKFDLQHCPGPISNASHSAVSRDHVPADRAAVFIKGSASLYRASLPLTAEVFTAPTWRLCCVMRTWRVGPVPIMGLSTLIRHCP